MISVASGPFQGLPHHHIAVIYADHPVGSTLGAAGPCRGLAAEERKTIKQKMPDEEQL